MLLLRFCRMGISSCQITSSVESPKSKLLLLRRRHLQLTIDQRRTMLRTSLIRLSRQTSVRLPAITTCEIPLASRCTARHHPRPQTRILSLSQRTKSKCRPRCESAGFTAVWKVYQLPHQFLPQAVAMSVWMRNWGRQVRMSYTSSLKVCLN